MLSFTLVAILLLVVNFVANTMDINQTVCDKGCGSYSFGQSPFNQDTRALNQFVNIKEDLYRKELLLTFPCPPDGWALLCSDLVEKQQFGTSLSCLDITNILKLCLKQTHKEFYSSLLWGCKDRLTCKEFSSLCSEYPVYCIDGYDRANVVPPLTINTENNELTYNKHMNNTTGIVMKTGASDSADIMLGSYNWHVLWVLIILVYIFVFVPCFLNFVIKWSIIDRLRNRCQKNRNKTVKTKCEEDEPPLIPVVHNDVYTPVVAENSIFIQSRPDSMASSIGEDFDFPYADESAAVSMVSLLIDEQR